MRDERSEQVKRACGPGLQLLLMVECSYAVRPLTFRDPAVTPIAANELEVKEEASSCAFGTNQAFLKISENANLSASYPKRGIVGRV